MDSLDALILRELGMEPFFAWPRRHAGFRLSDVARRLGRNLEFVKDRVGRMDAQGVIRGYRLFPNLRHLGLRFTVHRWPAPFVPDEDRLSRLGAVDGVVTVIWSLDSSLCIEFASADAAERARRLELIASLLDLPGQPSLLYERPFPPVPRRLTSLDWRIVRALEPDARRLPADVAKEVGVTAKTVRARFDAMWREGSVDRYVEVDFGRLSGIIPFQLCVWCAPGAEERVLRHLDDRYLAHARPADAYAGLLVRVFAHTPAEVQAIVREVLALGGVERAEAFVATGAYVNRRWLPELLERQPEAPAAGLP